MFNRIYLTGFMTSGKSTIGPILANVLGWQFYDLDRVIEKVEKKSIVEIFRDSGEDYFRGVETETLRELSGEDNAVIALGGGTLGSDVNYEILRTTGKLIYLRISPETIYQRLKNKIDRPLIRDLVLNERPKEEFIARIETILGQREVYYKKADCIFDTDSTRIGITVDRLAEKIRKMMHENN